MVFELQATVDLLPGERGPGTHRTGRCVGASGSLDVPKEINFLPQSGIEPRFVGCRLRLKCFGTRAKTRFRLSAKRTSPFKSAGASVQSTTGRRGVRISGSNARYTMFLGSVKGTGYPLHSPVSHFPPPPVRHRVPPNFNWTLQPLKGR